MYSRTDKQYLLHQRDIDFIDRFIFQAKIALSGSPEFAPIKLIQSLRGSYQKSENEQNIFEYLKENLAGSSGLSKPTTTEREIALEVVDSLQRGDEDKEIIKRITANRHIDKVATQDPIYSLAMDVLLDRERTRQSLIKGWNWRKPFVRKLWMPLMEVVAVPIGIFGKRE